MAEANEGPNDYAILSKRVSHLQERKRTHRFSRQERRMRKYRKSCEKLLRYLLEAQRFLDQGKSTIRTTALHRKIFSEFYGKSGDPTANFSTSWIATHFLTRIHENIASLCLPDGYLAGDDPFRAVISQTADKLRGYIAPPAKPNLEGSVTIPSEILDAITANIPRAIDQETTAPPANALCRLEAPTQHFAAGSRAKVKFIVDSSVDYAELNGKAVGSGASDLELVVHEDTKIHGRVIRQGKVETCELDLKVIKSDVKRIAELALCGPETGRGRNILVLQYANEFAGAEHHFARDLAEISASTGITFRHMLPAEISFNRIAAELKGEHYHGVWVISGTGNAGPNLLKPRKKLSEIFSRRGQVIGDDFAAVAAVIKALTQHGIGLAIFGDNDPFNAHANRLLQLNYPEWNLALGGNYWAQQTIHRADNPQAQIGRFFIHPVTSGIFRSISEGNTIANLQGAQPGSNITSDPSFREVIRSSNGAILAGAIETPLKDKKLAQLGSPSSSEGFVSRVFIHGAWTSMYRSHFEGVLFDNNNSWVWDSPVSPGTPQLFANIACWISGAR